MYLADGSTQNATTSNSIFLGYATRAAAGSGSNEIVIGASAIGAGSNTVTLGSTSITKTILQGNIGIGSTTPSALLTVSNAVGTAANTPLFTVASTTGGTSTSTLMTILATGNVGIGTTSPLARFSVAGNSYFGGNVTATGTLSVSGLTTLGSFTATAGTSTNLQATTLGVGGDYITDITGSGLTISSGALAVSTSTFFTTSAQFAQWLSDETGSGNVVFSASPTLTGTAVLANYTATNGTTTNASSTSFFSTNLFATGATTTALRTTTLGVGGDYITDITGSGLTISSGALAVSTSTFFTTSAQFAQWLSDETGSGNVVFSASPTLTGTAVLANYTATNGTTTNASSTSFFSTNLFATGATTTALRTTTLGVGGDYITDITGTGLSITGGVLNVTGDGVSNWVTTNGALTPSSTVGIGVFASSTIGGGTGLTGLTIFGGATTTGNAYFAGNIGIGSTSPNTKLTITGTEDLALLALADSTNARQANVYTGTTSPESRVAAPIGSLFIDTVNGALYQKTGDHGGTTLWNLFTQGTTTHMAKITRDAAQSISTASTTKIDFDTIEYDTGGLADLSAPDPRIIIRKQGKYLVTAGMAIPNLDAGESLYLYLSKNDTTIAEDWNDSGTTNNPHVWAEVTEVLDLQPGDYFELSLWQNEGAAQNTFTTPEQKATLSVVELAPTGGTGVDLFTDGGADTYLTATGDNLLLGTTSNSGTAKFTIVQQNAADLLNLFDGATEVLSVLDGGNVGIGTTSPLALLAVGGNSYFGGNVTATGTLTVSGLTTFGSFTATNGTTTNASSTNLFATNLFGTNLTVTGNTTLGAATSTSLRTTTLGVGGDYITDITGTGITLSGTSLTASLGTDIAAAEIANGDHGFFTYTTGVAALDTGGLTSANLASALSNETGSGSVVFSTAPTFSTSVNISSGGVYQINATTIARADTALGNYLFGGAGNGTMTGDLNIGVGSGALLANTIGAYNVAIGNEALTSNTEGTGNNAIGRVALQFNSTGGANTAIGDASMQFNATGTGNTALGYYSLKSNRASYNVAVGTLSLNQNWYGGYNVAVGYNSLASATSTSNLTAIGTSALYNNTFGTGNTALGYQSLYTNTSGSSNTALGYQSLYGLTTGSSNVALGLNAGRYLTNGSSDNQTSSNSLFLGNNTRASGAGVDNEIIIGSTAWGNGSNSVTLGSTTISKTILQGSVGIGTTSPNSKLDIWGNLNVGTSSTPTLFVSTASGNVGINNSNPTATLHVKSSQTNYNVLAFDNASNGNSFAGLFVDGSANAWFRLYDASNAEQVRINTSGSSYFNGGNFGIGSTTPNYKLTVANAAATAQFALSYDTTRFATMFVDASGNLNISSSNGTTTLTNDNLSVCQGGACPTSVATSTTGNLFVENAVTIGDGFSLRQVSSTELGLYNASGTMMVIFDNGN